MARAPASRASDLSEKDNERANSHHPIKERSVHDHLIQKLGCE
jgi:hypothetical protein